MSSPSYCYLLYTDQGPCSVLGTEKTYVGATIDPDRRLRQHNQEIVGGARATGIRVAQGLTWKRACYLTNLPEWRTALQIEWRWKQLGRTQWKHIRNPIDRRLYSLRTLLSLEKPTSKGIPYAAYPDGPPIIVWDSDEMKQRYESLR
jgi:predicted GIY-YIG superfamily endonuclease